MPDKPTDKKLMTLTIILPKGFYNTSITIDNHLIADTNDAIGWDTLKFPLPSGKWKIYSKKGKKVVLIKAKKK